MFFIGLLTLFFSSFLGALEKDFKKIIALRTLSQIGLCFLTFSLGYLFLRFFHLVSHAIFKSFLFIQVGNYIRIKMGEQDKRLFRNNIFQLK